MSGKQGSWQKWCSQRRAAAATGWRWIRVRALACWRRAYRQLHPWQPVVLVDARRKRARQLRRAIAHAARDYVYALGVPPPDRLLVVVQRVVVDREPLHALLQVFADGDGVRRQVLFLALSVGDRPVSTDELVATFRQHLRHVLGEAIGELTATVPLAAWAPSPARTTIIPPRRVFEPNVGASDWEMPLPDEDSMPTGWHENGTFAGTAG